MIIIGLPHNPLRLVSGVLRGDGRGQMFIVTVSLWCGDDIEIKTRHVEVVIMWAEQYYADAMATWTVRAA